MLSKETQETTPISHTIRTKNMKKSGKKRPELSYLDRLFAIPPLIAPDCFCGNFCGMVHLSMFVMCVRFV